MLPEARRLLMDATPVAARALVALAEDPGTATSVGGNGDPVIVAFAGVPQEWAK